MEDGVRVTWTNILQMRDLRGRSPAGISDSRGQDDRQIPLSPRERSTQSTDICGGAIAWLHLWLTPQTVSEIHSRHGNSSSLFSESGSVWGREISPDSFLFTFSLWQTSAQLSYFMLNRSIDVKALQHSHKAFADSCSRALKWFLL